jgi:hypothetical protein
MNRFARPMLMMAILVSACAPAGPNWAAIKQQADSIRAQCESQFASGVITTYLATEQCANPSIKSLYTSAGLRDLDILNALLAKREAYASQLDRKSISLQDEKALIATAIADANSQVQQRSTNRAVTGAAIMSTMPVTCTTIGYTTTCN